MELIQPKGDFNGWPIFPGDTSTEQLNIDRLIYKSLHANKIKKTPSDPTILDRVIDAFSQPLYINPEADFQPQNWNYITRVEFDKNYRNELSVMSDLRVLTDTLQNLRTPEFLNPKAVFNIINERLLKEKPPPFNLPRVSPPKVPDLASLTLKPPTLKPPTLKPPTLKPSSITAILKPPTLKPQPLKVTPSPQPVPPPLKSKVRSSKPPKSPSQKSLSSFSELETSPIKQPIVSPLSSISPISVLPGTDKQKVIPRSPRCLKMIL